MTGAAKGQGRNHAIRFAVQGADTIAVDVCRSKSWALSSRGYSFATDDDFAVTVKEVETLGRRIVGRVADMRDRDVMDDVIAEGVGALGRLNIV